MRLRRKIVAAFVAMTLAVTPMITPIQEVWAGGDESEYYKKLYYTISGNEVTITGCGSAETSVDIPESIEGCSVTKIKRLNSKNLKSVTIPASVTSIKSGALSCDLTSIVVDSGNSVYDSRDNCNAIIDTKTNTIIQGCSTTTIPNTVTNIGSYAFEGYAKESIDIPDSVTNIEVWAFHWSKLTSVTLPANVNVEDMAFNECHDLKRVSVSDSATNINIGGFAFGNCEELEELNISKGVKSIGSAAFWGTKISSVTIPASLTNVGIFAFPCGKLTSIEVDENNKVYDSRDNCNAIIETSTNKLILGCNSTKIPESVTAIGENAFMECKEISDITLTSNVTSIGKWGFLDCINLKNIEIPDSVTSIGESAFEGCDNLTIHTTAGSCAHKYAKENNIPYKVCDVHSYVTNIVKATTKNNGYIEDVCSVCDINNNKKVIYMPKTITLNTSTYTYDGKAKTPKLTVKDSAGKAIAATNYTVTYTNNKNVGTATAVVTFKGAKYSGTLKKNFAIKPATASIKAVVNNTGRKMKITWNNLKGISGYQIQYSTSKSFASSNKQVIVKGATNVSKIISNLTKAKTYYVRIRGYKTVGKANIYGNWSMKKSVKIS